MNKKKESKVVPNVRFKGFTDDWKQRKLVDYLEVSSEKNRDNRFTKEDVLSVSGEYGIVNQIEFQGRSFAGASVSNYGVVENGDVVYTKSPLKSNPYGIIKTNKGIPGIVSTLYAVYKPKEITDSKFVQIYFELDSRMNSYMRPLVNKGAKNDMKVSAENALKGMVSFPKKDEQEMISLYFSTLDNLITLHQQKITLLTKLKKTMLEKMFPKKGSLIPEIRFNGFANAWEQRKVLDLLIQPITDGPHETPKLVEEGVPFISVDAIVDNKIDFNRKRGNISEEYDELCCKKYKPQFHDVYLVKSGSTVGKVAIVETTDRFNIWSPLAAMRCGEKTYPYFLYDLLQTKDLQAQVADKASNGTQPNLSMRELEKFPVSVPSNLEEQKKIGDYFRNLDHLITLHQRKIDKIKNMKKAMLDQMFI